MTLIGILVMQDVLLGILIALLPNMASADVAASASSEALTYFILALKLAAGRWKMADVIYSSGMILKDLANQRV